MIKARSIIISIRSTTIFLCRRKMYISLGYWGTRGLEARFYDKIIVSLIRFSAPYQALVPLRKSLYWKLYRSPVHPQSVWITSVKLHDLRPRSLWLAQLDEDVTQLPINWSQLTNISLGGTSWGASSISLSVLRAHKLLSLCLNLITCRLEIGIMRGYSEELRSPSNPPWLLSPSHS